MTLIQIFFKLKILMVDGHWALFENWLVKFKRVELESDWLAVMSLARATVQSFPKFGKNWKMNQIGS